MKLNVPESAGPSVAGGEDFRIDFTMLRAFLAIRAALDRSGACADATPPAPRLSMR
jgi:hypothetical protein